MRKEVTFVNKKGIKKNVMVNITEEINEIIDLLDEDERNEYLENLYHETERERYHRRKYVLVNEITENRSNLESPEEQYFKDLEKKELTEKISKLSKRDQEYILLVYYEGKKQKEVAEKYGISPSALSHALKRIYDKLRK